MRDVLKHIALPKLQERPYEKTLIYNKSIVLSLVNFSLKKRVIASTRLLSLNYKNDFLIAIFNI